MNYKYFQPITYANKPLKDVLEARFGKDFEGAKLPDCILLLSSFCGLVSAEELSTFFWYPSFLNFKHRLSDLASEGMMVRVTLYHQGKETVDGRSSLLYGLSKKGYKYIKDRFRPEMGNYKQPSQQYACHDYGTSWSIMSLIANPYTNVVGRIDSELLFDKGKLTDRVRNDALRIDSVMDVGGDTVYLEEDRDTETIPKLRDKFFVYGIQGYSGIARDDSLVILSFKKPFVSLTSRSSVKSGKSLRYSVKHLEAAVELMKQHGELKDKDGVVKFNALHDEVAAGLIPSYPLTELSEALYAEVYSLGYTDFYKPEGFFSYEGSVADHLADLKGRLYKNYLYFYEYGKLQEEFCTKKRNALIEAILSDGLDKPFTLLPRDIQQYMMGFRLFCGSTFNIGHTYFFAFYEQSGIKEILERTIQQYIPSLDPLSYQAVYSIHADCALKRPDSPFTTFDMRNGYECGSCTLFIENLAFDISAAIRVKVASMCFKLRRRDAHDKGTALICLVRNEDEARYFYDLLGLSSVPSIKSDFRIMFLNITGVLDYVMQGLRVLPILLTPETSPLYCLSSSGEVKNISISKNYKGVR